jgi:hypothetical protein
LPVTESDLNIGRSPQDSGIPLFHHYPGSPLRIAMVNNPVTDFQIKGPSFFHDMLITKFFLPGNPKTKILLSNLKKI